MIGLPPVNAFVLQRTPYREESLLLRLLTVEAGQMTVVYRGSDPVYLYQPYHLVMQRAQDFQQISGVEPAGPVLRLPGETSYLALYLNELCGLLLPRGVPADAFFGTYYATLKSLQAGEPQEPLLRFFERQLLVQLGYAMDFTRDVDDQPIVAERNYRFDGVSRFQLAPGDSGEGGKPSPTLSGEVIQAMAKNDYVRPDVRRSAKHVLRQALQYHLGDAPLQSRRLFSTVNTQRKGAERPLDDGDRSADS